MTNEQLKRAAVEARRAFQEVLIDRCPNFVDDHAAPYHTPFEGTAPETQAAWMAAVGAVLQQVSENLQERSHALDGGATQNDEKGYDDGGPIRQLPERPETIVGVAYKSPHPTKIRFAIALPLPARHGHVLDAMRLAGLPKVYASPDLSGFVTSKGRFVDREEAYLIARDAKQIIARKEGYRKGEITQGPSLFSEDVW